MCHEPIVTSSTPRPAETQALLNTSLIGLVEILIQYVFLYLRVTNQACLCQRISDRKPQKTRIFIAWVENNRCHKPVDISSTYLPGENETVRRTSNPIENWLKLLLLFCIQHLYIDHNNHVCINIENTKTGIQKKVC